MISKRAVNAVVIDKQCLDENSQRRIMRYHKEYGLNALQRGFKAACDACKKEKMAGAEGFEPSNDGTKIRCLTNLATPL